VAVLVYAESAHMINSSWRRKTIRPEGATVLKNGYHIRAWSHRSFNFIAISMIGRPTRRVCEVDAAVSDGQAQGEGSKLKEWLAEPALPLKAATIIKPGFPASE